MSLWRRFLTDLDAPWPRRVLWAAIVVQGVLVAWFSQPWIAGDSTVYLHLAQSLDTGRYGMVTAEGFAPDPLRPPGYPLILWFFLHLLGLPVAALIVIQSAVCLFAIWLIERLLRGRRMNPIPFLLLAALYPFPALYSSWIMAESWAILAITFVALGIDDAGVRRTRLLLAGAICGAAALVRTDLLLLPLLIAGIVLVQAFRDRRGLADTVARAALPLAAAAIFLVPYAAWNQVNFGRFTPAPVASAVGNSLYLATWQGELSHEEMAPLYKGVVTQAAKEAGIADEIHRLNESLGAPKWVIGFNPAAFPTVEMQIRSTEVYGAAALRRIREDPWPYLKTVTANLWRLWNTSNYPSSVPPTAQLYLSLVSAAVCLLGLVGILLTLARPRGWPVGLPLTAVFLYVPAVHLLLHTEARYTAAVRPLLLLFASLALVWIGQAISRRLGRRRARLGAPPATTVR